MSDKKTGHANAPTNQQPVVQLQTWKVAAERRKRSEPDNAANASNEGIPTSEATRRDLQTYYALLAQELPQFTAPEAELLTVASGDISFEDPEATGRLWAIVGDAVHQGSAHTMQMDGKALIAHLQHLSPVQTMAVVDAIEQVRNFQARTIQRGQRVSRGELLAKLWDVGLIAVPGADTSASKSGSGPSSGPAAGRSEWTPAE